MAHDLVAKAEGDAASAFEYSPRMSSPFLSFQALSVTSTVGFFAVNPWTGDVWALWGCHKLDTRALRKDQAAIRRKFSATELKQYARLSALKPFCTFED
jgi:hypothetical protein